MIFLVIWMVSLDLEKVQTQHGRMTRVELHCRSTISGLWFSRIQKNHSGKEKMKRLFSFRFVVTVTLFDWMQFFFCWVFRTSKCQLFSGLFGVNDFFCAWSLFVFWIENFLKTKLQDLIAQSFHAKVTTITFSTSRLLILCTRINLPNTQPYQHANNFAIVITYVDTDNSANITTYIGTNDQNLSFY